MNRNAFGLLLLLTFVGCTLPQKWDSPPLSTPPPVVRQAQPISIATWNLQVFGKTKAGRPEVLSTVARVISMFDVIAIQEIKDKTGEAFSMLMQKFLQRYLLLSV